MIVACIDDAARKHPHEYTSIKGDACGKHRLKVHWSLFSRHRIFTATAHAAKIEAHRGRQEAICCIIHVADFYGCAAYCRTLTTSILDTNTNNAFAYKQFNYLIPFDAYVVRADAYFTYLLHALTQVSQCLIRAMHKYCRWKLLDERYASTSTITRQTKEVA